MTVEESATQPDPGTEDMVIAVSRQKFSQLMIAMVFFVLGFGVALLLVQLNTENTAAESASAEADRESRTAELIAQINPLDGYTIPYTYGDVGPQLVEAGAIDLERFAQVYEDAGNPLTSEQMQILAEGSSEPITINQENAHFLLNLFWALGLANQNEILEEGPLMRGGREQIARYASTGGWTLASQPVQEVYSSMPIVVLSADQQARVAVAAENTYRPCCNNSTAFADCNHGMAMLGLFELMAGQGATLGELFDAAKYFNAFWFPQQTFDLANFFEVTANQSFAEIDAAMLVSAQFSSGSGWGAVRQWLVENGSAEELGGGGSCGV